RSVWECAGLRASMGLHQPVGVGSRAARARSGNAKPTAKAATAYHRRPLAAWPKPRPPPPGLGHGGAASWMRRCRRPRVGMASAVVTTALLLPGIQSGWTGFVSASPGSGRSRLVRLGQTTYFWPQILPVLPRRHRRPLRRAAHTAARERVL